jgi:integrase
VLVRVVLKRAVQFGVLMRMPDLPVAPKQSRKLPAAPTIETIEILLRGSEGWLRYAIALAYFANMRNSEARAFQVRDADFKSGVVTVRRTFSHDELRIPKSGAERSIPMAKRLKAILAEAVRDKKPTDFIVADASGEPPSRQFLYKAFRALEKRLGIDPQWSFHALRHACGTHAASLGANVEAVRDLMGPKDLTTTTRYVHAVAKDKAAVITALNGQLEGNG